MQTSIPKQAREKDAEGFEKVGNKKRMVKQQPTLESQSKTQPANRFAVLSEIMEEGEGSEDREKHEEQTKECSKRVSMSKN